MAEPILTEKDNGKQMEVSVGTQIRLDLPENPTTGYQWTLHDFGDVLALKSDQYVLSPPFAVGGGGVRQFSFEAAFPGKATICLRNMRPWEGEEAAVETFTVTLIVRK